MPRVLLTETPPCSPASTLRTARHPPRAQASRDARSDNVAYRPYSGGRRTASRGDGGKHRLDPPPPLGHHVLWFPEGRSAETTQRAAAAGMEAVASLDEMVGRCEIIVSICPPMPRAWAARWRPRRDASVGYTSMPTPSLRPRPGPWPVLVTAGGARYLDGGVIGAPPRRGQHFTRLYLSGNRRVGRCGTALVSGARCLCLGRVTHGRLGVEDGLRGVDERYGRTDSGRQGHGGALRGR